MNPLDENKWVLDKYNRNIQYLCNSGNIIQLDLPKNGKLSDLDFLWITYNIARFKYDYFIPGDESSKKVVLLNLLKEQFKSTIQNNIKSLINKDKFDNYYEFTGKLTNLLLNKYINDKEFDLYIRKIEIKIINYLFPNKNLIIPKNIKQFLIKTEMPICYKGQTYLFIHHNGKHLMRTFYTEDFN